MTYADDIRRFQVKVAAATRDTFVDFVSALKGSIVEGSPVTGAPGQPVDTGALRNSWQDVVAPDFSEATIGTNVVYAPPIEDGVGRFGPLTLRSKVGGFHSVKLTVANADALLVDVAERHTV
jgi:hypothetical protein